MIPDSLRLDELGERRIVEEILRPRYSRDADRFGDDCALITEGHSVGGGTVVATTDPCPEPMAVLLGYDRLYYRGWLLATINLSDLAAAGARPVAMLTSLVLRNDTTVSELRDLLDGIDHCCGICNTRVVGGNLKEGAKIDISATAIGICETGGRLSRAGCEEGDLIVVVGDLGSFWAGTLAVRHHVTMDESTEKRLLHNVLTPVPKVGIARELVEKGTLKACIDNSDGLYPSLVQLADANQVRMHISMDGIQFPEQVMSICSTLGIDPVRLALGWGDWQLIASLDTAKLRELEDVGARHRVPTFVIGRVERGRGVVLEHHGKIGPMMPIDSQRFTRDSWFTAGIESYIDLMVEGPLWVA